MTPISRGSRITEFVLQSSSPLSSRRVRFSLTESILLASGASAIQRGIDPHNEQNRHDERADGIRVPIEKRHPLGERPIEIGMGQMIGLDL